MRKCLNCGTEFEGKFCPECGSPAPPETCPKCGTPVRNGAKFCTECGYSFKPSALFGPQAAEIPAQEPAPAREETAAKQEKPQKREEPRGPYPFLVFLLKLLPYCFSVLFALFSAAVLLSYLGSLTGGPMPLFGSIYNTAGQLGKIEIEDLASIPGVCVALIVLASVSLAYALLLVLFRLDLRLRVKKIYRGNLRVVTVMECAAYALYFVQFVFGCVLCAKTKSLLTEPGAAPICILVFSLIFLLLSAGIHLCIGFEKQWFPAVWMKIEEDKQTVRNGLNAPVAPKGGRPEKPEKPALPTVVEETDTLRKKVNRYIRNKRLALCLVGFFFPFLAIGGLIGLLCSIKKPKGWHPENVFSKRGALITLTVFDGLEMLVMFWFTFREWVRLFYNIKSVIEHGFLTQTIFASALPFTIAFLICTAAFVFSIVVLVRGKKLTLFLFGTKKPMKDSARVMRYYTACKAYEEHYDEQMRTYRIQKWAWKQYRKKRARYEAHYADGVPYRPASRETPK